MTLLGPDERGSSPGQVGRMPSPAPTGAELTTALRTALLDPERWREPLGRVRPRHQPRRGAYR